MAKKRSTKSKAAASGTPSPKTPGIAKKENGTPKSIKSPAASSAKKNGNTPKNQVKATPQALKNGKKSETTPKATAPGIPSPKTQGIAKKENGTPKNQIKATPQTLAKSPKNGKKAETTPKSSEKSPKNTPSAKKATSLDDSIIKDSKASKLNEFLQKQKVSAKKPMNFDKFAKELGWSSDDLSDSDVDLLEEESDDGLVYAEDGEEDEDEDMLAEDDTLSELSVEDDEEDLFEDEEDSMSITGDEQEENIEDGEKEEEDESDADFQIVKTVTRGDSKCEGAKFEFITQGKTALKSLLSSQEKKKGKSKLFAEESSGVYVDIKYKLPAFVSMGTGARKLIEIPFPERNPSNASLCLILPDLSHNDKDKKDPDVDKQARDWADILRDKFGITGRDVAKIVTLNQLKRECRDQKSKREFIRAYDIFLVDRSIFTSIVYHLGREVQKGGHLPIPFKVTARNVPEQLKKAYRLTQMDLRSGVGQIQIRIGNLLQGNNQLNANFVAVADAIFAFAPFGHKNIKTAQIVTDQNAIQLPFYVDFSPKAELVTTKPKQLRGQVIVDEVSTLPDNLQVKVDNGVVTVIDAATKKKVLYPTHKDEREPRDDIKPIPAAQIIGRQRMAEKKQKKEKKLKMKKKAKSDLRRAETLKRKLQDSEKSAGQPDTKKVKTDSGNKKKKTEEGSKKEVAISAKKGKEEGSKKSKEVISAKKEKEEKKASTAAAAKSKAQPLASKPAEVKSKKEKSVPASKKQNSVKPKGKISKKK